MKNEDPWLDNTGIPELDPSTFIEIKNHPSLPDSNINTESKLTFTVRSLDWGNKHLNFKWRIARTIK